MARPRPALLVLALVATTPAAALSDVSLVEIGRAYCTAIVAGDDISLAPLLTPELAALTATADLRLHGGDTAPTACLPVGASGTLEHPESVLFLTYPGGATGSEKLVLSFVDDNLRIDDIVHSDGLTLRDELAP
jgi:hypothetical protein